MKGKSKKPGFYSNPFRDGDSDFYYDSDEIFSPKSRRNRDPERYMYGFAPNSSPTMGSVEIKAEDGAVDGEAQSSSAATCRICLEQDSDSGDELIAPCLCKGTQQFVHRSCLDHWRSVKEGFAFAHCTTCRAQFHLRINFLEGSCWRNIKFRMYVTRDILAVFLAVQMSISVLGGLTYLCDLNGTFRKSIGHGWDHIFSNHPVLFYYCLGALIFFALLGIFGLILQCTSYGMHNSNQNSHGRSNSAQAESVYCCNGPCFIDCSSDGTDGDCCAGVLILVVILVFVLAAVGIFYGIFGATICFQRIWQKHYHILTKRKLTEEYIVEDLCGHYTQPKLDEEHRERLRMLDLL